VAVRLPDGGMAGLRELPELFHARHRAVYGYADESGGLEIINLRVQAVGGVRKPERLAPRGASPAEGHQRSDISPARHRPAVLDGVAMQAAVYRRAELPMGISLEGPMIVTQYDTTTFVPPSYRVSVDDWLNLIGEVA
jgi:N-methylhydantoinase A